MAACRKAYGVGRRSGSQGAAGTGTVIGIAVALWSASGYVAAFMRAANIMYEMPEGRPIWKTLPLRLAITLVLVVMMNEKEKPRRRVSVLSLLG
ncbi:YhjD/YihY/BrkB family envelope integrity protein [Nonomuraea endophytica]|uniref:YhjD/YihY/BrkB family envelope integrity protein n=1 Tax=Nonomuraea endophytica TaxID=714136 RepID=UPI0035E4381E